MSGVKLIAISLVSMAILAGLLAWNSRGEMGRPIIVYCAAALQPAIEEIGRNFHTETGQRIQATYGASQVLLAKLELTRDGDLFIPADDDYLRIAAERQLVVSRTPLTQLAPVLGVATGNPLGLKSLADLERPAVRLALANPETAAISRVVREKLGARWAALQARARVLRITVGDVAADIKLGVADAGFIWDETARQVSGLDSVVIPELSGVRAQVAIALLTTAAQPDEAGRFIRFVVAPDRGGKVMVRRGYRAIAGDPWNGSR